MGKRKQIFQNKESIKLHSSQEQEAPARILPEKNNLEIEPYIAKVELEGHRWEENSSKCSNKEFDKFEKIVAV